MKRIAEKEFIRQTAFRIMVHLKKLRLPNIFKDYDKVTDKCSTESIDHTGNLAHLTELELINRGRRMVDRRIRLANFSAITNFGSLYFAAIPEPNKMQVLTRCEYIG